MHISLRSTISNSVLFLAGLLLINTAFARERGPRVEVICPAPPIPVSMQQQKVLVYELHVTNFDSVPLTLKRLEVFAGTDSSNPLISLVDAKLSAAMTRVGAAMSSGGSKGQGEDSRTIQPGGRNVIFMWIELPGAAPSSLRHRMVFSPGADGKTDSTLEDFQVSPRQDPVPMLSPPFKGGIWVAGDGPANDSGHRRSIFAIDGHLYSPERFAIDWMKVGPNGDSTHDGNTRNENWWGWGEPALAVADGEITEVVDGFADNVPRVLPPVTLDNITGNHLILQIAPDRYVTYAHLQNGRIKVRLHEKVHRGDVLALLGNSGNSTGAHLHFQVTDRNSVLQSEGVPFLFERFTYLGPGSDYPEKQVSVPWTNSIPPGNGVLGFEAGSK
jgi:murein DD-endopeptidase